MTFPLPVLSSWATYDEIQLSSICGTEEWGSYTLKVIRIRKDEFIKVHGVHADGLNFSWDYDAPAEDTQTQVNV